MTNDENRVKRLDARILALEARFKTLQNIVSGDPENPETIKASLYMLVLQIDKELHGDEHSDWNGGLVKEHSKLKNKIYKTEWWLKGAYAAASAALAFAVWVLEHKPKEP